MAGVRVGDLVIDLVTLLGVDGCDSATNSWVEVDDFPRTLEEVGVEACGKGAGDAEATDLDLDDALVEGMVLLSGKL